MLYIILIFLLLIIIILLLWKNKVEFYQNIDGLLHDSGENDILNVEIKKYKTIMLDNNKKKLYKIGLNDSITVTDEDCYDKCDQSNCIKMSDKKKLLNECLKCNIQKNKCYNKSIIGGNCDDCNIENIEDKLDCYDVKNFGCPNPKNLNYSVGVDPYYIQIKDNNINSPYNKKCVFCWNILDNI
jgi:hypothetical protein